MASIEIRVGIEHHLTLVHFEEMPPEKVDRVHSVLEDLILLVKKPPRGVFGDVGMYGRYRNMRGIGIVSPYVLALGSKLRETLTAQDIEWSKDWLLNPHVAKPLDGWNPGTPVPFATFLGFRFRRTDNSRDYRTYDLV